MSFSHRDRRAHRTLWRILGGVGAGTLVLCGLAMFGPDVAFGLGALVGLAVLGWVGMAEGEEAVREYDHDLRSVTAGSDGDGFVRAEVRSDVGLERPIGFPAVRSPHTRPPTRSG
ncbi:MAG: hypothetical protein ACLPZM_02465 [Thermoplasmata archaeon]